MGVQLIGCCCGFVEPILQAIVEALAEYMLLPMMLMDVPVCIALQTIICLRPLALAILNMVAGWMAVRFLMAM